MSKDTVRAVLVGCGSICNAWLKGIKDDPRAQIVGLVDLVPENMAKVAEAHGLGAVPQSTDLAALLAQVKPDAVFNCTIPEAHLPVTMTALEHGCHVLSEKPLADTMENARTMVAAAEKAGRIFAVIQNRRYQTQIRSLKAFLESGAIGKVHTVNTDFYIGAHFGGFRDRMEHVLLLDMAIHSFDQGRLISGADPVDVYCHEWNPAGSWYDHDASAHCIFGMSDGIVLNYRGSWCCEGLNTTWECDWRVIGEKGCVTWNGGGDFKAQVVDEVGGFFSKMTDVEIPILDDAKAGAHGGNIAEFLTCVLEGGTPETTGADNIKSLAMVFGAIESAETGRKVAIRI
jgi:predicted dehydrogenase